MNNVIDDINKLLLPKLKELAILLDVKNRSKLKKKELVNVIRKEIKDKEKLAIVEEYLKKVNPENADDTNNSNKQSDESLENKLNNLKIVVLKKIAKNLELKKYYALNKKTLIKTILENVNSSNKQIILDNIQNKDVDNSKNYYQNMKMEELKKEAKLLQISEIYKYNKQQLINAIVEKKNEQGKIIDIDNSSKLIYYNKNELETMTLTQLKEVGKLLKIPKLYLYKKQHKQELINLILNLQVASNEEENVKIKKNEEINKEIVNDNKIYVDDILSLINTKQNKNITEIQKIQLEVLECLGIKNDRVYFHNEIENDEIEDIDEEIEE
jgi:hypothetical protein